MAKPKLYNSEIYLRKRLLRERKTPEEVAAECGVTPRTIRNNMKKFGIK